ncbi:hypothetical protein CMI42_06325 [Candidatus Pacearchaeota archaeon]|nr:hypothetical protein [Candidatus Pacearchaeota archaeon]|tara:strand:+ start:497 stop:886 length:390 start_codon:yes stop_codon:yes gene_type:complete
MHPEIESTIREGARNFLSNICLENGGIYSTTAEAGYISFDDIYFLGIHNAAGTFALETIVESGKAPIVGANESVPFPTVEQDNPDFKRMEDELTYKLISEILGIDGDEAQERFYEIYAGIEKYVNDKSD